MPRRLLLVVLFCCALGCRAQVITTVAGGVPLIVRDGGLAVQAPLGQVQGIAVDAAGNVYAADFESHIVFKVAPDNRFTIVAGNQIPIFSGDGGPATSASFRFIYDVAVAPNGDLYVADSGNARIRKVAANGIVTTAAVLTSPRGVTVTSAGVVYATDFARHQVLRLDSDGRTVVVAGTGVGGYSGDGGPATQARLFEPRGIAVDAQGNLYVADARNNRVRRITPGGIISTVAGNGTTFCCQMGDGGPATASSVYYPTGVTTDSGGNLYIAELGGFAIRRVNPAGIISVVGPLGQRFSQPVAIGRDSSGNLYIAETFNRRVSKLSPDGTVTTVAGNGLRGVNLETGLAIETSLSRSGIAVDSMGNIHVNDRDNLRVRTIRPDGRLVTIFGAGGPTSRFSNTWDGIAADRLGNIYFSTQSFRIFRIDPAGVVSTFAGAGCPANYTTPGAPIGDGGPATQACLGDPSYGLAADAEGNVYIISRAIPRVRKVDRNGIITTVAGGGTNFPGDGGPATAALLINPSQLTVDTAGNVIFSMGGRVRRVDRNGVLQTLASGSGPFGAVAVDRLGNVHAVQGVATQGDRVVRIDPGGVLTPIAGTGIPGFSGDGGPAVNAQFNSAEDLAFDAAGNLFIADNGNRRIRKVTAATPAFSVTPASLRFSVAAGSGSSPAQQLSLSTTVAAVAFTAQPSDPWLLVAPAAGVTPRGVEIRVNAASLTAGAYRGSIRVQAPGAAPPLLEVPVDLTVVEAAPPRLSIETAALTFQAIRAANPAPQNIQIRNAGGGTLNWTALVEDGGRGWLGVSPLSGTATPGTPGSLQVQPATASLAAGTYRGAITVTTATAGERVVVEVTLVIAAEQRSLLISPNGLFFTAVEGDGAVPPQTVGVLNVGQGSMAWTARITDTATCGWLSVTPSSGSSEALAGDVPLLTVGANAGGLAAGRYACHVRIEAAGASGSPRLVSVFLQVLPAGSVAPPLVRPTSLIFVRRSGSGSPSSQLVGLATAARSGVAAHITSSTFENVQWLNTLETDLGLAPGQPRTVTAQPDIGTLAPGQYFGTIDLKFRDVASLAFGAQTVEVLFVVTAPNPAAAHSASEDSFANGCTAARLFPALRTLGNNASVAVGYPATLEVQVRDDCDVVVNNAVTIASFSNGDPPVPLISLRNGIYTASWRPSRAQEVLVTIRAQQGSLSGTATALVFATTPTLVSAISTGGIVHGASFAQGGLAPGSIVSVFGAGMAAATASATFVPLPTQLGGATLNIGGVAAPLFYSSEGQVNAQIPFETQPGTPQAYLRVTRQGSSLLTDAETLTVVPARPGVFAVGRPDGQGVVIDAQGRLVDANAPAAADDIVVVYATGLGAVDRTVQTGQASPADPAARTILAPSVTIGGRPAVVHFAGLTPGLVGLYQINVQIPAGIAPGSAIPLVVTQNGVPSNTVTLAIK